jgi:hypothetical protein
MKEVRLTDLDELALKVRDRIARSYVLEAIDAYRGGAYRSSIVSTWISVTFDIISKIRELANQGDPMAQHFITSLDQAITNKQIRQLQNIEEDLLKTATADFEFLSDHEQIDLARLKDDRNLCAHPAFIAEEVLFEPEPERVRMHIVHVVKHLLQHQPIQGKSAIKRIVRDIKTTSFPPTLDTACTFLNSRYLDRAKKTLIENLVFLLLKAVLRGDVADLPLVYSRQMILTLQAISRRYPDIYEERMRTKLLTIVESLAEGCLPNVFRLLGADPRCWNWFDESTKIHMKAVAQQSLNIPSIRNFVFEAIVIDDLKPTIVEGFEKLSSELQISVIKSTPQPDFADRAIALYSEAGSYRGAEYLGESLILPMAGAGCFIVTDIQKVLKAAQENNQIYDASGTPAILDELYEKTKQYLPDLHESWKSFFDFLFPKYSRRYNEADNSDVWSETNWESLVNHLKAAGVSLPSGGETTS